MHRLRCLGALLVACAVILPALATEKDDKPEPTKTPSDPAKVASNEKWLTVADMMGTLAKVNPASLTLKVQYQERGPVTRGQLPKLVTKTKEFEFLLAEDVKVRIGAPPTEFDDKGNIKKHSPEELKALKGGDAKAWGFPAETNVLKAGEQVRIFVARKKNASGKKDALEDNQPVVRTIYVLKEAPAGDKK